MNAFLIILLTINVLTKSGNCLPYRDPWTRYKSRDDYYEDYYLRRVPKLSTTPDKIQEFITNHLSWFPVPKTEGDELSARAADPASKATTPRRRKRSDVWTLQVGEMTQSPRPDEADWSTSPSSVTPSPQSPASTMQTTLQIASPGPVKKFGFSAKSSRFKEKLKNLTHPLRYRGSAKHYTSEMYNSGRIIVHPKSSHVEKIIRPASDPMLGFPRMSYLSPSFKTLTLHLPNYSFPEMMKENLDSKQEIFNISKSASGSQNLDGPIVNTLEAPPRSDGVTSSSESLSPSSSDQSADNQFLNIMLKVPMQAQHSVPPRSSSQLSVSVKQSIQSPDHLKSLKFPETVAGYRPLSPELLRLLEPFLEPPTNIKSTQRIKSLKHSCLGDLSQPQRKWLSPINNNDMHSAGTPPGLDPLSLYLDLLENNPPPEPLECTSDLDSPSSPPPLSMSSDLPDNDRELSTPSSSSPESSQYQLESFLQSLDPSSLSSSPASIQSSQTALDHLPELSSTHLDLPEGVTQSPDSSTHHPLDLSSTEPPSSVPDYPQEPSVELPESPETGQDLNEHPDSSPRPQFELGHTEEPLSPMCDRFQPPQDTSPPLQSGYPLSPSNVDPVSNYPENMPPPPPPPTREPRPQDYYKALRRSPMYSQSLKTNFSPREYSESEKVQLSLPPMLDYPEVSSAVDDSQPTKDQPSLIDEYPYLDRNSPASDYFSSEMSSPVLQTPGRGKTYKDGYSRLFPRLFQSEEQVTKPSLQSINSHSDSYLPNVWKYNGVPVRKYPPSEESLRRLPDTGEYLRPVRRRLSPSEVFFQSRLNPPLADEYFPLLQKYSVPDGYSRTRPYSSSDEFSGGSITPRFFSQPLRRLRPLEELFPTLDKSGIPTLDYSQDADEQPLPEYDPRFHAPSPSYDYLHSSMFQRVHPLRPSSPYRFTQSSNAFLPPRVQSYSRKQSPYEDSLYSSRDYYPQAFQPFVPKGGRNYPRFRSYPMIHLAQEGSQSLERVSISPDRSLPLLHRSLSQFSYPLTRMHPLKVSKLLSNYFEPSESRQFQEPFSEYYQSQHPPFASSYRADVHGSARPVHDFADSPETFSDIFPEFLPSFDFSSSFSLPMYPKFLESFQLIPQSTTRPISSTGGIQPLKDRNSYRPKARKFRGRLAGVAQSLNRHSQAYNPLPGISRIPHEFLYEPRYLSTQEYFESSRQSISPNRYTQLYQDNLRPEQLLDQMLAPLKSDYDLFQTFLPQSDRLESSSQALNFDAERQPSHAPSIQDQRLAQYLRYRTSLQRLSESYWYSQVYHSPSYSPGLGRGPYAKHPSYMEPSLEYSHLRQPQLAPDHVPFQPRLVQGPPYKYARPRKIVPMAKYTQSFRVFPLTEYFESFQQIPQFCEIGQLFQPSPLDKRRKYGENEPTPVSEPYKFLHLHMSHHLAEPGAARSHESQSSPHKTESIFRHYWHLFRRPGPDTHRSPSDSTRGKVLQSFPDPRDPFDLSWGPSYPQVSHEFIPLECSKSRHKQPPPGGAPPSDFSPYWGHLGPNPVEHRKPHPPSKHVHTTHGRMHHQKQSTGKHQPNRPVPEVLDVPSSLDALPFPGLCQKHVDFPPYSHGADRTPGEHPLLPKIPDFESPKPSEHFLKPFQPRQGPPSREEESQHLSKVFPHYPEILDTNHQQMDHGESSQPHKPQTLPDWSWHSPQKPDILRDFLDLSKSGVWKSSYPYFQDGSNTLRQQQQQQQVKEVLQTFKHPKLSPSSNHMQRLKQDSPSVHSEPTLTTQTPEPYQSTEYTQGAKTPSEPPAHLEQIERPKQNYLHRKDQHSSNRIQTEEKASEKSDTQSISSTLSTKTESPYQSLHRGSPQQSSEDNQTLQKVSEAPKESQTFNQRQETSDSSQYSQQYQQYPNSPSKMLEYPGYSRYFKTMPGYYILRPAQQISQVSNAQIEASQLQTPKNKQSIQSDLQPVPAVSQNSEQASAGQEYLSKLSAPQLQPPETQKSFQNSDETLELIQMSMQRVPEDENSFEQDFGFAMKDNKLAPSDSLRTSDTSKEREMPDPGLTKDISQPLQLPDMADTEPQPLKTSKSSEPVIVSSEQDQPTASETTTDQTQDEPSRYRNASSPISPASSPDSVELLLNVRLDTTEESSSPEPTTESSESSESDDTPEIKKLNKQKPISYWKSSLESSTLDSMSADEILDLFEPSSVLDMTFKPPELQESRQSGSNASDNLLGGNLQLELSEVPNLFDSNQQSDKNSRYNGILSPYESSESPKSSIDLKGEPSEPSGEDIPTSELLKLFNPDRSLHSSELPGLFGKERENTQDSSSFERLDSSPESSLGEVLQYPKATYNPLSSKSKYTNQWPEQLELFKFSGKADEPDLLPQKLPESQELSPSLKTRADELRSSSAEGVAQSTLYDFAKVTEEPLLALFESSQAFESEFGPSTDRQSSKGVTADSSADEQYPFTSFPDATSTSPEDSVDVRSLFKDAGFRGDSDFFADDFSVDQPFASPMYSRPRKEVSVVEPATEMSGDALSLSKSSDDTTLEGRADSSQIPPPLASSTKAPTSLEPQHHHLSPQRKIKIIIDLESEKKESKMSRNADDESFVAQLEGDTNTNTTHILGTAGEMASDLAGRVTNLWHCVLGSHHIPETRDVRFYLYTRRNIIQPELLNINYDLINKKVQAKPDRTDIKCVDLHPDQIEDFERVSDENREIIKSNFLNIRAPTKILIHGYTGSYKDSRMSKIKDAYLNIGRYNVIQVDWEMLAAPPCYIRVTHHSKFVGETIAQLLNGLHLVGLNMSLVHLIGFSLGAQVAGFTGNNLTLVPVCRITGLDPALPLFLHTRPSGHLDRLDAKFVDVIHTCGGILAMLDPLGHVDFYPNGGTRQPGCDFSNLKCSHSRAPQYFAESVTSLKKFTGQWCRTWEEYVAGDCDNTTDTSYMGEPCSRKSVSGKYYLLTRNKEPFVL